jgi:hypothetical protein
MRLLRKLLMRFVTFAVLVVVIGALALARRSRHTEYPGLAVELRHHAPRSSYPFTSALAKIVTAMPDMICAILNFSIEAPDPRA